MRWEVFPPCLYFRRICKGLELILYTFGGIHYWSHLGLGFSLWEGFWSLIQFLQRVFYSKSAGNEFSSFSFISECVSLLLRYIFTVFQFYFWGIFFFSTLKMTFMVSDEKSTFKSSFLYKQRIIFLWLVSRILSLFLFFRGLIMMWAWISLNLRFSELLGSVGFCLLSNLIYINSLFLQIILFKKYSSGILMT